MPIPVSRTSKRTVHWSGPSATTSTRSSTRPSSVNLMAFDRRFRRDLAKPRVVALHPVGKISVHDRIEHQVLLRCDRHHDGAGAGDESGQRQGAVGELELAGLDLAEVENVVDHAQQGLARGLDHRQALALSIGQVLAHHQPREADDGVHRRADLVAHVGEEEGFRAVGLVGPQAGLLEFEIELAQGSVAPQHLALDRLERGHVVEDPEAPAHAPTGEGHGGDAIGGGRITRHLPDPVERRAAPGQQGRDAAIDGGGRIDPCEESPESIAEPGRVQLAVAHLQHPGSRAVHERRPAVVVDQHDRLRHRRHDRRQADHRILGDQGDGRRGGKRAQGRPQACPGILEPGGQDRSCVPPEQQPVRALQRGQEPDGGRRRQMGEQRRGEAFVLPGTCHHKAFGLAGSGEVQAAARVERRHGRHDDGALALGAWPGQGQDEACARQVPEGGEAIDHRRLSTPPPGRGSSRLGR